jgi:Sigma 54 modulation protein / S30EA ribosomal protein
VQIQINTDHNIEGHEAMAAEVTRVVADALQRFSGRITRVEVHLDDANGAKGGLNDKRCMLEARLEGRQPIAVTHHADTITQAVHGAAENLVRVIESTLARAAHSTESRA